MDSKEEATAEGYRHVTTTDNSGGSTTTMALQRKRARRVSFAEMTSVHFINRDEEDNETPLAKAAKMDRVSANELDFGLELEQSKEIGGEYIDAEEMEMPISFLRPLGSPSPGGSTIGSASSNDGKFQHSALIVMAIYGFQTLYNQYRCFHVDKDVKFLSTMWVVHSVDSMNYRHNIVLDYLGLVVQSIKVVVGPMEGTSFSFEANDTYLMKNVPNMDSYTAVEFVFNAEVKCKYAGSKTLVREIQVTSSLIGTLLDVFEEVQLAQIEFHNLTESSFCSPSESILDEIKDALKSLKTGYTRILRLCSCVSQVVQATSSAQNHEDK